MFTKMGLMFHNLGQTQACYCVIKNVLMLPPQIATVLFYNVYDIPYIYHRIPTMQTLKAFDFNGILIANDIPSALFLSNTIGSTQKYIYLWDNFWQYIQDYRTNMILFNNPTIQLIARTEKQALLIERVWKKPAAIIEDYNYEHITRLVTTTS